MKTIVIHCASCDAPLSTPVSRTTEFLAVTRPTVQWSYNHHLRRVPYGTYMMDPYSYTLSSANIENTILVRDLLDGRCHGTGLPGRPNRACVSCGTLVGTFFDDCRHWQEMELYTRMVTAVPGPPAAPSQEFFGPEVAYGDWVNGSVQSDPDATAELISREFSKLLSGVLTRAAEGRFFLADGPAELLRHLFETREYGRPRRFELYRMPAVHDVAWWRAVATGAGLTPERLASAVRPVTVIDFAGPEAPFSAGLSLFRQWCAEDGVPVDNLHVLGIVPRRECPWVDWWRWARDTEWVGDLPASAVHTVALDPLLWSFLVTDPADTARCLAGTRWGHPDLPEMVRRDEGPHCPHELADIFGFGRRDTFKSSHRHRATT